MLKLFHFITARCELWVTVKAPFVGACTEAAPAVTWAPVGKSTAEDVIDSTESPSRASAATTRFRAEADFPCPLDISETATQVLDILFQTMR